MTLMTPAEQQKILRLKSQASPQEIVEAESGLTAWEDKIQNTDKLLSNKLSHSEQDKCGQDLRRTSPTQKSKRLPPVRCGTAVISSVTHSANIQNITGKDDKSEDVAYRLRISGTFLYK